MTDTPSSNDEERGTTPYVAGALAIWDDADPILYAFSHWRCPHCGANLSRENRICLNACGLSVAAYRVMQRGLIEADQKVNGKK